jgi:hypothetical protein
MYAKTNANAMLRGIQDFIKASQESN